MNQNVYIFLAVMNLKKIIIIRIHGHISQNEQKNHIIHVIIMKEQLYYLNQR